MAEKQGSSRWKLQLVSLRPEGDPLRRVPFIRFQITDYEVTLPSSAAKREKIRSEMEERYRKINRRSKVRIRPSSWRLPF